MKYDVFISYSTFDEAIARDVCRVLEENGICCWIALRDAKPGYPYACEIMSGIEKSKMLLLIFSSNSNLSEPVASEIEEAFNKKKPIIVFLIENKPMAPELKFFLKRKHWLVAYPDYKQKLGNLVHATHDILGISKPKVVVNDEPSSHFWDFFTSSTFKVSFKYFVVLLIVVSVGVGAWSSFIVQTSKQPDTEREQYVKDSLMAEFERKEKARIAEQQRLEKERLAKEAAEKERLEKILSTPRSSKGLLCVAAVNKNSHEIAYFTADEWNSLPQNVKTGYAQVGVSISEDCHEFIIAPTDCKDPDDGDYVLQFGCYGMEFDRVIQYKEISEFIATGYNDTKNIVEQAKGKIDSKGIKGAPAAEAAWNYKTNEYDNLQWYLPSVSELKMIYRSKNAINSFIDGYIPKGEQIKSPYYCYWSSTVWSSCASWYVNMSYGISINYYNRFYSYRVRAVALAK